MSRHRRGRSPSRIRTGLLPWMFWLTLASLLTGVAANAVAIARAIAGQ